MLTENKNRAYGVGAENRWIGMISDFKLIMSAYYQYGAKCPSTFPSNSRRDAGLLQWGTGNVKACIVHGEYWNQTL